MSVNAVVNEELLRDKCATTQKPDAKLSECLNCDAILPIHVGAGRPRKYCVACNGHRNALRGMEREMEGELKSALSSIAFRYVNRDRYIPINFGLGTYTGPLNKSITWSVKLAKDKGYHAMPIDVHVRAIESKYVGGLDVQIDGQNQAWHSSFPHSVNMPRKHNTFCAVCVEMVIDESAHQVRVTKGIYLPIEHTCNSVRVYDLRGTLLEVKPL